MVKIKMNFFMISTGLYDNSDEEKYIFEIGAETPVIDVKLETNGICSPTEFSYNGKLGYSTMYSGKEELQHSFGIKYEFLDELEQYTISFDIPHNTRYIPKLKGEGTTKFNDMILETNLNFGIRDSEFKFNVRGEKEILYEENGAKWSVATKFEDERETILECESTAIISEELYSYTYESNFQDELKHKLFFTWAKNFVINSSSKFIHKRGSFEYNFETIEHGYRLMVILITIQISNQTY